jgi:hypothetical protein
MRPAVPWPSALIVVWTPTLPVLSCDGLYHVRETSSWSRRKRPGAHLHDDGKDNSLLYTELGGLDHGIPDAADVLASVASGRHF